MQRTQTPPNKTVSDKSNPGNTIQKLPTKTSSESKKVASSEKSGFFNLFQKLGCSNTNLADDKSEVFKVPKFEPK